MRFHAVLRGVETERPVEWHSQGMKAAEAWARLVLKKYPAGRVEIYERAPVLVKTMRTEDAAPDVGRVDEMDEGAQ